MIKEELINLRRYFHKNAEPGWMEFKTTDKIIGELENLDLKLFYGKEIYYHKRLGLYDSKNLRLYKNSVKLKTEDKKDEILDSFTGAIALIDSGKSGPNIGFRFDIDANDLKESESRGHIPNIKNFASKNDFAMHACGHDAHTAIGISLCKYFAQNKDKFRGKILVIFQPAEEGVRGAYSLMRNPLIDKLDYMAAMHIGMDLPSGFISVGSGGFLATKKLDISFKGRASHAGASPEKGHNALLAASSAILNFNNLSQNSNGISRINVGVLKAGSGRNIIPNKSILKMEIRGENQNIIDYLYDGVLRIVKGAALSFECSFNIDLVGSAPALLGYDENFINNLKLYYKDKSYKLKDWDLKGSEDVAYFLNVVNKNSGKPVHFILGSDIKDNHHSEDFDINEKDMVRGFNMMKDLVFYINKN